MTSRLAMLTVRAEKALLLFTLFVHTYIALLVAASPSSFGSAMYYLAALMGIVYCNATHWHRAHGLLLRSGGAMTAPAGGRPHAD